MPQSLIPLAWRRCPRIPLRLAAQLAAGIDPDGTPCTVAQNNCSDYYLDRIRKSLDQTATLLMDAGYASIQTEDNLEIDGILVELSPEFVGSLSDTHLLPLELRDAITAHNFEVTQIDEPDDNELSFVSKLTSFAENFSLLDRAPSSYPNWDQTPIGSWFATCDQGPSLHVTGVELQHWLSQQARAEHQTTTPAPADELVAGLREFAKTYCLFRVAIFADALEFFTESAAPLDFETYLKGDAFRSKFMPRGGAAFNEKDAVTVSSLFLPKGTGPGRPKGTKGAPK